MLFHIILPMNLLIFYNPAVVSTLPFARHAKSQLFTLLSPCRPHSPRRFGGRQGKASGIFEQVNNARFKAMTGAPGMSP